MSTHHGWCVHALVNASWHWQISVVLSNHALANIAWHWPLQIVPNICPHTMTDACRTWMILHSIGKCHLQYVHLTCKMRDVFDWCCLSFANVAYLKRTSLGWLCLSLANVIIYHMTHKHHRLCMHSLDDYECYSLISVVRCVQTTSDACRPWLMHPAIGRCHLSKA